MDSATQGLLRRWKAGDISVICPLVMALLREGESPTFFEDTYDIPKFATWDCIKGFSPGYCELAIAYLCSELKYREFHFDTDLLRVSLSENFKNTDYEFWANLVLLRNPVTQPAVHMAYPTNLDIEDFERESPYCLISWTNVPRRGYFLRTNTARLRVKWADLHDPKAVAAIAQKLIEIFAAEWDGWSHGRRTDILDFQP